jgi:hypothetical protein
MVIGNSGQSFYVMPEGGFVYVMATAYLTVIVPESQGSPVAVRFLYDTTLSAQPITLVQNLSLSQTVTAAKGATWLFIGLEVRTRVLRNFPFPNPPLEERSGFGLVDLRAPGQNTHSLHPLLMETGPIRVPRIGVSVCQPELEVFIE